MDLFVKSLGGLGFSKFCNSLVHRIYMIQLTVECENSSVWSILACVFNGNDLIIREKVLSPSLTFSYY